MLKILADDLDSPAETGPHFSSRPNTRPLHSFLRGDFVAAIVEEELQASHGLTVKMAANLHTTPDGLPVLMGIHTAEPGRYEIVEIQTPERMKARSNLALPGTLRVRVLPRVADLNGSPRP